MFHYFDAIHDTKGNALIGYFVMLRSAVDGSTVSIYADESSTPIISVSGVENAAEVDSDGNADFFVAGGTYHMDIYATDATTLVKTISNVPMIDLASVQNITDGDKGDITTANDFADWTINDHAVTDAKLRQGTALSVIGRASNSTGDVADITGADGQVLRVSGTTLGFGTIATAGIADGAVTLAKQANMAASSLIGNNLVSSAVPAVLGVTQVLSLLGLNTGDSPQFTAINLGHASDTTIARSGAGDITVEGNAVYRAGGTDVPLADGGTGASLSDPNADRIMFWDDSAGQVTWLTLGTNLSITGTTLDAASSGGVTDGDKGDIVVSGSGATWTIESNFYKASGTDVALADGGTGASLTDPNADRIMFWDDSAGAVTWLVPSTGLSISGTNLTVDQTAVKPTEVLMFACSDETTAITTGTAKLTFRMPYAFTLSAVRASVTTAPTGSTIIIDINEGGTTILSTKLSIDASEKTSTTAASAAVISDTSLADDAEMTIDFDQVGSTIAGAGVKVYLIGTRT